MRYRRAARRLIPLAMLLVIASLAPTAAAGPQTQHARFSLGHGLSVSAPPRGYGVAASAITATGEDLGLVLETDADGVTRVIPDQVAAAGAGASSVARVTGSPNACTDSAYHLLPMKWKSQWKWWFQYRSTPSEITRRGAQSRLRSAVASITGERNDCGRPDHVNARSKYQGRTTLPPGVKSNGGCGAQDGWSVVGFGSLPQGVLALTCTLYQKVRGGVDTAVESDVLFNKRQFQWATSQVGCDNQKAMLRSIATHEFGHVFGLNHVSEATHGNLTMSPAIGACDNSAFTLGLGDMRGLERRY